MATKKIPLNPKRIITVNMNTISPYELEGALGSLKESLDRWIAEYGENARINYDRTGSDPYSDSPEFQIQIQREETDEEYEKRVILERQRTATREEHDRKEFERLKEKFGKKNA